MNKREFLKAVSITSAGIYLPPSIAGNNSNLERYINTYIRKQRALGKIASNERTAWSIYDFKTKKKLVSINEESVLQAASMIKVFVAVAYFYLNKVNSHKYPYNNSIRRTIESMLVHSSNSSTNKIIKKCGGPERTYRMCQKASKNIFKSLRIVEYIPSNGRTYKNKASAHDYSRLLYAIWENKLPNSSEIKRIMLIKNGDRIRTKTDLPSSLNIYDKTGSTGLLCGNIGVIELPRKNNIAYTFIGIIEGKNKPRNYSEWIRSRGNTLRSVSELTYKFMYSRYDLLGIV